MKNKDNELFDGIYLTTKTITHNFYNTPQIVFETTEKCNLQCKYCFYGSMYQNQNRRERVDLSLAKAIQLLRFFKYQWSSEPSLYSNQTVDIGFYGGEPLLNFKLIYGIIDFIEKEMPEQVIHRKISFSMTTNALLLPQYMDYIVSKNIKVTISLDGNERATSYRVLKNGKSAFSKITDSISQFEKNHPVFFREKISFSAVLHDRNDPESVYEYFKQEWKKTPSLGSLNSIGVLADKLDYFSTMSSNLNHDKISEDVQKKIWKFDPEYIQMYSYLLHNSPFVYVDYNELLFGKDYKNKIDFPTGTCVPFSRKIFVTAKGHLLPCEHIGLDFILGSVTDSEVCLNFAEIAQIYNDLYEKSEYICKKCYNNKTCTSCIFSSGIIDQKKCNGFMTKKQFSSFENQVFDFFAQNPTLYKEMMLHGTIASR